MREETSSRIRRLQETASPCRLCPRACDAQREAAHGAEPETGYCGSAGGAHTARVASVFPHFGEEEVLTGVWAGGASDPLPRSGAGTARRGSGTVFFSGCNLLCVFCQNYELSRGLDVSRTMDVDELAGLCLLLQDRGCANVNFVTPTHFAPALAAAVETARRRGLTLPIVWNCGGYERVEVLRELKGTVDVYMPDFKSLDPAFCRTHLHAPDYPEVARAALREMARQVGPLQCDDAGLARSGLLVRHLVMPGMLQDACRVIDEVAAACPGTAINVMGQYRPCGRAPRFPDLARRPDPADVVQLRRYAEEQGLWELNHHPTAVERHDVG